MQNVLLATKNGHMLPTGQRHAPQKVTIKGSHHVLKYVVQCIVHYALQGAVHVPGAWCMVHGHAGVTG